MDGKYSIGQMSKLFKLPVKTLRYYDEIGLFKPSYVNQETGYRFYDTEQFEHISTIIFLKILGMPLKKIKAHLENPDIDDFLQLLKDQQKETELRIAELEEIKEKFQTRITAIEEAKNINNFGTVVIKQFPQRRIVLLKEAIFLDTRLELLLKKLESKLNVTLPVIIGNVVLRMSKEKMRSYQFNEYNAIGMILESNMIEPTIYEEINQGPFACIYFKGGHENAYQYYQKLINYIRVNNYHIIGDSIERTISNEFITKDKEHHITEIQLPINM